MSNSPVYTLEDNGIHRFYWADVKPTSVDEFVSLYNRIQPSLPENSIVRVLHDYKDTETPSFSSISNAMKSFNIRDDLTLRIAHLYNDVWYPTIVKNASLVTGFEAERKFFRASEEQKAIEWLLSDE